MTNDFPTRIMACEPFLQRLGFRRIRPRQNSTVDIDALQSQRTPTPYPILSIGHKPASRVLEPLHGLSELWPWSEQEILIHSNVIRHSKGTP